MNLRSFAKLSSLAASLALLTGCAHNGTVYRAVSDLSVTRTGDIGSAGPLVLVASQPGAKKTAAPQPDYGAVFDRMSVVQIGIRDPTMGGYLRTQREAQDKVAELRAAQPQDSEAIKAAEQKEAVATKQVEDYAREWRDLQRKQAVASGGIPDQTASREAMRRTEAEAAASAARQTVLMIAKNSQWAGYDSRYAQTIVLILDGPPQPGEYWLTADNSVLITASAWSAPARTRVGLTGSIKILEVRGNQIVADVAVRKTLQGDSAEAIDRLYDPAAYEFPWEVHGRHKFQVTSPNDPAFAEASVRWVTE